jgi:hypothetical protein
MTHEKITKSNLYNDKEIKKEFYINGEPTEIFKDFLKHIS